MTHKSSPLPALPTPTTSPKPPEAAETSPEMPPFPTADTVDLDGALAPLAGSKTPIIGIGASAGGLEALEKFFSHVSPKSGLAYVVVQHLDPVKESLLPELLQRYSQMPVVQVRDITLVEANHVYVAPPGFEVTLLHGVLHLLKPVAPRGLQLPIDFFLRALALDQQANAAGVILSGMGSDGTLGLRALKERAGGVFVQTPGTAMFDAMPRNAVDSGLADVVAPADQLPEKILAYFSHPLLVGPLDERMADRLHNALEKILILVRAHTGHDFTEYKKSTVYRRIQRRMAIYQIDGVDDYMKYLRENPVEAELLFKELLIGVTCFFRDPEVWQHVKLEVLPALLAAYPAGGELRAWVPACSTGEEAYTLAILFLEALAELKPAGRFTLQIFATDMDKDAIEKGRTGFYPENIASDVSPERLARFFTKVPGGYKVSKAIRSMIIFAPQSLASDPPFAKLHVLSCRNLLIYLEAELQQKLVSMFHSSLNPGGYLVLGQAETVGVANNMFAAVGAKTRIYRRLGGARGQGALAFPLQGTVARMKAQELTVRAAAVPSLQTLADQLLMKKLAPTAVLVTGQGDIVYFSGKTSKYLEPPAGKANLNLFAMLRPSLRQPLADIFYRTVRQKIAAKMDAVSLGENGVGSTVRISVEPVEELNALDGMFMVVFSDMGPVPAQAVKPVSGEPPKDARVPELMLELARAREEHQATREEMQTSQEELKSANEELQSANEELTTSREEMQSMNEELQTVNSELQSRVDAFGRANDDMENLLNSTDIATLFLDRLLHVRRFTLRATHIIKLIPGDIGRPISDLTTDLKADLSTDAADVLRTLIFREKDVEASGNRWFRVRIMPYRTQDNRIDGVVITFTDITSPKSLESSVQAKAPHS